MKKIYFVLVCAAAMLFTVDANAQLGVGAGYNLGSFISNFDDASDNLNGFYLEGTYDWNFIDKSWGIFALQPGVRFSYMGNSEAEKEGGIKTKASVNETYIDIPVNLKYSYDFGSFKVSAFAGPDFSMGLTSTYKIVTKIDDEKAKVVSHNYSGKLVYKGGGESDSMDGGTTDYSRFDIKFGIGAGVTFMDNLHVKLGYNFGLMNRVKNVEDTKTNVFYVGLGIMF